MIRNDSSLLLMTGGHVPNTYRKEVHMKSVGQVCETVCVHHVLLAVLPPGCQGSVEFTSRDGMGQHQTAVHHGQTLLELQFHPQPLVLRQSQLGRTQTPERGKPTRGSSSEGRCSPVMWCKVWMFLLVLIFVDIILR